MKQPERQTSYFLIGQKDLVSSSILVKLRDGGSSHAMISEEHSRSLRSGEKTMKQGKMTQLLAKSFHQVNSICKGNSHFK